MAENLDTAPLSMHKTGLKKDTLEGDVAVVTGGTSNIGLGVARSLAWLGVKIVLAARNDERGKSAEKFINDENGGGSALYVKTDVSDENSMKKMAEKAISTYGKVDILVNNAMDMSLAAPILKTPLQQMDRQYEVAVRGALIGIQLFVPGMKVRKHGVVTYLSTAFNYPVGPSNYCAAKSATSSIMMSLANELGPDSGVSVFTFLPSSVGRPRTAIPEGERTFMVHPAMPGYEGAIPPEDCGAALAYSITRASELHGSGIIIQQAFRQMNWPFPKPETVQKSDYHRINDRVLSLMFAYMGPGFPDPKVPLTSINREDA
jgi:NAD(P)-dependent dehydrogenase (short-subunit alcohol dehydrogenase family)